MTDLRESVARAVRDEAEYETTGYDDRHICNWPDIASAALRAIADAGPSEKMVEAAARVMAVHWVGPGGDQAARVEAVWRDFIEETRSALSAALKEMGAG